MKAVLFVSGDEQSKNLLIMLKNRYDLKDKLKKVKINMRLKEPVLNIGAKKKVGFNDILQYFATPARQQTRPNINKTPKEFSYEDIAYSCLYSDDAKSQLDDDEVDDEIKSKKKIQYEQQYERQSDRLNNMSKPPKRIPVEQPQYQQSLEEQTEDNLMKYFTEILGQSGN